MSYISIFNKQYPILSIFLFIFIAATISSLFYNYICSSFAKEGFETDSSDKKSGYIDNQIATTEPTDREIFISLSTSPKRIENIGPLIKTLSNQTVKPTKIVLNLPFIFKRTNTTFSELPDFVTNNPLVYINWCEDIGPSTKVIPTVKLASSPESILISVDDDIEYKPTLVETLLKYSDKHPEAVITGESFMRLPSSNNSNKDTSTQYAELVEGYSSVLYKKKHIADFTEETILNYPKFCYLADDFIISNHLRKKGVPIVVITSTNDKPYGEIFLSYGNGDDSLRNGANGNSNGNIDNYKKCASHLKSKNDLHIKYVFE